MTHAAEYRLIAHAVAEQNARRWQGNTHPQPKDTPHERTRTD